MKELEINDVCCVNDDREFLRKKNEYLRAKLENAEEVQAVCCLIIL